jgi:hypothetical protein
MGIDSHLSTCVGTQSPKYLEMAQGHISLSKYPLVHAFFGQCSPTGVNRKLELWWEILEFKDFRLNGTKTEYMRCDFDTTTHEEDVSLDFGRSSNI